MSAKRILEEQEELENEDLKVRVIDYVSGAALRSLVRWNSEVQIIGSGAAGKARDGDGSSESDSSSCSCADCRDRGTFEMRIGVCEMHARMLFFSRDKA
ncbi:hypothetical protein ACS0TY_035388 [Phlomoides rotata]